MDLFQVSAPAAHGFPSLRPRLTRDQAIEAFSGGARQLLVWMRRDRLCSIADAYVPYYLFRVDIFDGRRHQADSFAIDAVTGSLDLYRFAPDATDLDLVSVKSRNRIAPVLTADEAWLRVADTLRRLLFQSGFFRLRRLQITGVRAAIDLHLPYWVAFYERDARVRLDVMDAVRRRIEGAKARALFEAWLAPSSGD
jgi:hypothetical protein